MTRIKLDRRDLQRARRFVRDHDGECHFVSAEVPIIVGFTQGTGTGSFQIISLTAMPAPALRRSSVGAPDGHMWLTLTLPVGGAVACRWMPPYGDIRESWIIKAAAAADLQPGDTGYLDRRLTILRVMATTQQSAAAVRPVVKEVGGTYAIEGILLVAWLRAKFRGNFEQVTTWLEEFHPNNVSSSAQRTVRDELVGNKHEAAEWYDLRQILLAAYRFTHPKGS